LILKAFYPPLFLFPPPWVLFPLPPAEIIDIGVADEPGGVSSFPPKSFVKDPYLFFLPSLFSITTTWLLSGVQWCQRATAAPMSGNGPFLPLERKKKAPQMIFLSLPSRLRGSGSCQNMFCPFPPAKTPLHPHRIPTFPLPSKRFSYLPQPREIASLLVLENRRRLLPCAGWYMRFRRPAGRPPFISPNSFCLFQVNPGRTSHPLLFDLRGPSDLCRRHLDYLLSA